MAEPRTGEPLRLIAGRERIGRIATEERLLSFHAWYELVRRDFAGGQER